MNEKLLSDGGWSRLEARLPSGLDVAGSARTLGALRRARGVPAAAALLRLALVYGNTPLSLRGTACWAQSVGVAELSDVALLHRLQRAGPWLEAILAELLAVRLAPMATAGRAVEIVDATTLELEGRHDRAAWRIHARLGLASGTVSGLVLTEADGTESLDRFQATPGAIVLADRIYAKMKGIEPVVAAGADILIRYGLTGCTLRDGEGRPLTLTTLLRRQAPGAGLDVPVQLPLGADRLHPARLVLLAKPSAAAAKSRRQARRKAMKTSKAPSAKQLAAADYLVLLTTLDAATWPPARLALLYRQRWQIELLFKRMKSILHLDDLQAKDRDLARTTILAKLIWALLTEDRVLAFPPSGTRPPATLALAPHQAGRARHADHPAGPTPRPGTTPTAP